MNIEKNRAIYRKFITALDDSSSRSKVGIEQIVSGVYSLFLNGFVPTEFPSSDWGKQIIQDMNGYSKINLAKKEVELCSAKREFLTETEAHTSLVLADRLNRNLIMPLFTCQSDFSNSVFNDFYNLGLAYLHSIVAAVAQEYVNEEEAFHAKINAVKIASKGIRLSEAYHKMNFGRSLDACSKKFSRALEKAQVDFLRPFELTPTSPKKIYHGKELMKSIAEKVSQTDEHGEFLFKPYAIFPIAHGGSEVGIQLAHAYQDKGYSPIIYPLLYSIKTRRHREPWIQHDSHFLNRSLEDKDVLITEDWVTTGNTLRGILNEIERRYPHETRVATIKRDPQQSKIPLLNKYHFYVGQWAEYCGPKNDSLKN